MKLLRKEILSVEFGTIAQKGKFPIMVTFSNTIPVGWLADINEINYISDYGHVITQQYDHGVFHDLLMHLATNKTWAGLTTPEKDIIITHHAHYNDTDKLTHLLGQGHSEADAVGILKNNFKMHHHKMVEACNQRFKYAKEVVVDYLQYADAELFFNTVENAQLISPFLSTARFGTNYRDDTPGIIDWIESTSIYTTNGLAAQLYTPTQGTITNFISALKDVLVDGNYAKY